MVRVETVHSHHKCGKEGVKNGIIRIEIVTSLSCSHNYLVVVSLQKSYGKIQSCQVIYHHEDNLCI